MLKSLDWFCLLLGSTCLGIAGSLALAEVLFWESGLLVFLSFLWFGLSEWIHHHAESSLPHCQIKKVNRFQVTTLQ